MSEGKHVSGLQERYGFNQRAISFFSPSLYVKNPGQKIACSQNRYFTNLGTIPKAHLPGMLTASSGTTETKTQKNPLYACPHAGVKQLFSFSQSISFILQG